MPESKSLQRSPEVEDFYKTGIEIWTGFGPAGITEKKIGANYEQLLPTFEASLFMFSWAKKNIQKRCRVCTKMKLKTIFFLFKKLKKKKYRLGDFFNCVLLTPHC